MNLEDQVRNMILGSSRPPPPGLQRPTSPNAFNRGSQQQRRQLYQPNAHPAPPRGPQRNGQPHWRQLQAQYLDSIAAAELPRVEMTQYERDDKETFRKALEDVCIDVCNASKHLPKVSLQCFGSFQSGFASAGSDMDLVIVVQDSDASACFSLLENDLPRALEKRLLQIGYGARLLSRTRVPIIKVCQAPGMSLLSKLRQEREKWDDLDPDKKYFDLHLKKEREEDVDDDFGLPVLDDTAPKQPSPESPSPEHDTQTVRELAQTVKSSPERVATTDKPRREPWKRERTSGALDFPKDGVGIQSDINFFNPLGIHNTQLLRCYSLCDPRIRPIVLFVKAWAKKRHINSSYSGTLSSYGYVLMVLHYLTNIARPAVLPNLQQPWRPNPNCTPQSADVTSVDDFTVDFWRREAEITGAAAAGQLTPNRQSVGSLLAGFFTYYSSQGGYPQFHWMNEVISVRTQGGLLSKQDKGWTKAVTEEGEGKKVQHRYLFCVEDPFELSHNVARTVTHAGIVAIRDEFRRAWRILRARGNGEFATGYDGELMDAFVEQERREAKVKGFDIKDAESWPTLGALKGI
ncbi:hypothetical protein LTR95_005507 [Oleoguttula sp. CCFEE 5521]